MVYLKSSLYADCIILVVSLIVLARVIFIFKRRDWFLILTPAFFLLHGIFYLPYDYLTKNHRSNSIELRNGLSVAGYFCYLMGHWTFSAQYLQTAMILPKLFIEAKLEWLLKHT